MITHINVPQKIFKQLKKPQNKNKNKHTYKQSLNQHHTRLTNSNGSTIPGNGAILMRGTLGSRFLFVPLPLLLSSPLKTQSYYSIGFCRLHRDCCASILVYN